MGYGPTSKAIDWVKDVFRQYPDRIGILCLHDYYTKTQTLSDDGKLWYDKVVRTSPNLYMVLCGHKYGAYCFPEAFDDDGDPMEFRLYPLGEDRFGRKGGMLELTFGDGCVKYDDLTCKKL